MYRRPTILNKTLTLADTEYSQVIPDDSKKLVIKSRLFGNLKIAFVENESGTNYLTIPAGSTGYALDAVHLKDLTLYAQSDVAGDVCEILCWK